MSSPSPSSTLPPSSTSSVAAASPSSSSGSSPMGITNNATLYIYTFLATLVLLLAISSAIVIRSLILRRRHQRLVEEAIRAGTWRPHDFDPITGRRKRDFGEKPKLWEAWVHASDDSESDANEKSKWGDITPIYAAYVNPPMSLAQGPFSGSADRSIDSPSRMHRFLRPFMRSLGPSSSQPSSVLPVVSPTRSVSPSSPASSTSPAPEPAVRVAILIAMPSPSPKHHPHTHHHRDECGTPVVEIGVIEAGLKEIDDASTSHDPS